MTVGRRWFWGGPTLRQLRAHPPAGNLFWPLLPDGNGPPSPACGNAGRPLLPDSDGPPSPACGRGAGGEGGTLAPPSSPFDPNSAAGNSQLVSPTPAPALSPSESEPAAIIFTTGSTGPPKGVMFTHANFDAQVDQIRDRYGIQPGEIDLPCFPLFGLFNCAMGVTAVIPDMDPSRPAQADPAKVLAAAQDWNVTQAFGSPAVWDRVGRYCESRGIKMPAIRRVLSAGAPIPAEVLRLMKACIHAEGNVHTPYGATEALPVATISATEVLGLSGEQPPPAEQTRRGAGVCVGRRFSGIRWKVIRVVDGPIESLAAIEELAPGEIGELIVRGPVVTRRYVTRVASNALAKIADGPERLAPHGRLRLPRLAGAVLVLRPSGAPRADGGRADVSGPLRGDFQPAPGRPSHRAGGDWPAGPATPGDHRRAAIPADARHS